ncbi:hypothetical protein KGQ34_01200 [Patescibacteria group bacterium]|nr:hypothetical protein [Patescibacteria group bacterium]
MQKTAFQTIKKILLDLLFPIYCVGCGASGVHLCKKCAEILQQSAITPSCVICSLRNFSGNTCKTCQKYTHIKKWLWCFNYKNPAIRSALHRYKYKRIQTLGIALSELVQNVLISQEIRLPKNILVAPIPLSRAKERERGFNQALPIAKTIADMFRATLITDALVRKVHNPPQAQINDFKKRQKNVQGIFRVKNRDAIRGKTILLVDDVTASRSTLEEAACVLRTAGAKSVWAFVIAKG